MPFQMPFLKSKPRISGNTIVGITESGKREITRYSSGGSDFDVIAPLDDRATMSVTNLSRETGIPYDELIKKLEKLERQRFVVFMGRED